MSYVLSITHQQLVALIHVLSALRDRDDSAVINDILAALEKAAQRRKP